MGFNEALKDIAVKSGVVENLTLRLAKSKIIAVSFKEGTTQTQKDEISEQLLRKAQELKPEWPFEIQEEIVLEASFQSVGGR